MPPEEEQATSMRDDFDSAISAIEDDDENAITTETAAEQQEITAEDLNDGTEQETQAAAEDAPQAEAGNAETAEAGEPEDTGEPESADTDSGGDTGADLAKAPASWSPAAREGWDELPEAVRAQVTKREGQITAALENGKEHRKAGERFNTIAQQYAQVIAAEGVTDPLTGFEEMMKSLSTLRMGSPEQKAQKIAQFIKGYGIPIATLDDVLSGQMPAGAPDPDDPVAKMVNERLKPVDDLLNRVTAAERQRNYEANQKAIEEVTAFKAANEFYTDVQNDMADLVEMAEKRGYVMPLEEAYTKACAANPEISKILAERAENERLMNAGQTLQQKQHAASSIAGKRGGGDAPRGDLSLSEQLAEAWDSQVG